MNAVTASFTDYKVADISLADYGRKEIKLCLVLVVLLQARLMRLFRLDIPLLMW